MNEYVKKALDTPDLLNILKQRGLVVTDDRAALHLLSYISYFRLASYFRPLERDCQTHEFRQGTTLEQVLSLYEFDTALRDMVFRATRPIEQPHSHSQRGFMEVILHRMIYSISSGRIYVYVFSLRSHYTNK